MGKPEQKRREKNVDSISIFSANTRSLKGKTEELSSETHDYEIVCLTETHIDSSIPDHQIFDYNNKIIYRNDRNIHGGGVLIAINNDLVSSQINIDNTTNTELLFVRVKETLIIGCYYRPQTDKTLATLSIALDTLAQKFPKDHIILVGDMNLPGIDWHKMLTKPLSHDRKLHMDFISMLELQNMKQLVRKPTHIHGNILDLLCSNHPERIKQHSVIYPGLSDHFIVTATVEFALSRMMEATKVVKLYREANKEGFQTDLAKVICELKGMSNVEEMWKLFSSSLKRAIHDHVPTKVVNEWPKNEPVWFNRESRKLVHKQRKLYNRYRADGDPFHQKQYNKARRESKKVLKKIKENYVDKRLCKPLLEGNSKPFYRHLKGAKKSKDQIRLKRPDNSVTEEPFEIATILNKYFHSQFNKYHQLPENTSSLDNNAVPEIQTTGVTKLIRDLKRGKAPGPDGLRKEDLMVDVELTAACLSCIYKKSLEQGKLPAEWKTANVAPIHKSGSKESEKNYRPISLTSIPCKMIEHIILRNLLEKVDKALHHRQHGFRSGLSCETQLCATMHDILSTIDNEVSVHAAVLDFTKAFDRVPHALLIQKLSKIADIDEYLVRWVHNFLTNRTQRVVLDGCRSDPLPVTSGVPQGSVLGPVLFLIYINDLPDCVDCSVGLFADDTLLYQAITNQSDVMKFQQNLNSLSTWTKTWGMDFNLTKSKIIAFKQKLPVPSYTLNGYVLEHTANIRYLGVMLQENLQFDSHIETKISNAKRQLGMVKRALHWAPQKAKLIAYKSLCLPHLEYASAVWDPTSTKATNALEMVQNQATRFISNLKGREGVTDAKEKLGLKPLQERRQSQRLSLLMRILSKEESHPALCSSYDDLMDRPSNFIQTRAQSRGLPTSISCNHTLYHNSFLPRTIRELKEKLHH